jgi:heat shock protein HtpX
MSKIAQYKIKATDWRSSLQSNQRRTIEVIILFFLIYCVVGFIFDLYLYDTYRQPNPLYNSYSSFYSYYSGYSGSVASGAHSNHTPLSTIALNLITFKIFPIATAIMLAVATLSLAITYAFHRGLIMLGTDYHEVTADNATTLEEKQLYNVVEEMRIASSLGFMPKVYIIEADYMNAFASGYSEKTALIAITRGLLQKLDREELAAVMAHELSHVRHNDIRLVLTAVVLSNLILIAFDIIFRGVLYGRRSENNGLVFIIIIIRFLLPVITLLLMLYLSRTREYMADAGCVELMRNNEPLARALLKIHEDHTENQAAYDHAYQETPHENVRRVSYFYSPKDAGIALIGSINNIFSTHPSLENRLKALGIEKKLDKPTE